MRRDGEWLGLQQWVMWALESQKTCAEYASAAWTGEDGTTTHMALVDCFAALRSLQQATKRKAGTLQHCSPERYKDC